MSQEPEDEARAVVRQTEELLARSRQMMEEQDEAMRKAGLDPAAVRAMGVDRLNDRQRAEVEAFVKPQFEALERAAQQAFDAVSEAPSRPLKPRNLI